MNKEMLDRGWVRILTAGMVVAGLLAPMTSVSQAQAVSGPVGNPANLMLARDQWFQRIHGAGDAKQTSIDYATALKQAKSVPPLSAKTVWRTAVAGSANVSGNGLAIWQSLGPAPIPGGQTFSSASNVSGRVTSIALSGTDIYIGTANGGVWESTTNGQSWTPLTDNQPSLAIGSIAIDPVNPQIIYAGTGEENFGGDCYFGRGILKSMDGGQTWTQLGASVFNGLKVASVIVDPQADHLVYVAAGDGVYESTDSGNTWNKIYDGNQKDVTSLVMSPTDPSTLYAAVDGVGIFETTDGGSSWSALTSGLPTSGIGRIALAIAPSNAQVMYSAFATDTKGGSELQGFYTSIDGGQTWTQDTNTPPYFDDNYGYGGTPGQQGQGFYDNVIAVDPNNPQHVIAGGITLVESNDGGQTWTNIVQQQSLSIHPDQHAIVFDSSGDIYIGNDGGVWEYTAAGQLNDLNTNLSITQFYPGISQANNGTQILAGSQDNGTSLYKAASGWSFVQSGDGGYTATDPRNPSTIYCETEQGDIMRSTDDGVTWNDISPTYQNQAPFITPFILSPSNPDEILVGANSVHESTNDGQTWTTISQPFQLNNLADPINAIAEAPGNPNDIYVGTLNGQVFATFNGGTNWAEVSPPAQSSNVSPTVTAIAVDPNHPTSIYVTYGSYNTLLDMTDHVYYTADASQSTPLWTDISNNLPNAPVDAALCTSTMLYVGTDVGVFASPLGQGNWSSINQGLPNSPVTGMVMTDDGKNLIVSTHGRGVFETVLPDTLVISSSLTNGTKVVAGQSQKLTALYNGQDISSQVSWTSDNPSVATVDSSGNVTAVGSGTTSIQVSYNGQSATFTLSVVTISSLTTANNPVALTLGTPQTIKVIANYSDGTSSDVTSMLQSLDSSNPAVVTVNSAGQLTPVAKGEATITATYYGQTLSIQVTVTPPVTSLTVNLPTMTLDQNGGPVTYQVIANYSDGSTADVTQSVQLSFSNEDVGYNSTSLFGMQPGSDTITFSYGNVQQAVTLQVLPIQSVAFAPNTPTILIEGQQNAYMLLASYSDGNTANMDGNATWTSGNPSVVTVDSFGNVTAVGLGATSISAALNGQTYSIPITVVKVSSLSTTPNPVTLKLGTTQSMVVTAVYSNGASSDVTSQLQGWYTSDPTVVTVNSSGQLTPVAPGTAEISVSYFNQTLQVPVTVVPVMTGITVSVPEKALDLYGNSGSYQVVAHYNDGSSTDVTQEVQIANSNGNIKVNEGVLSGVKPGSDSINFSYQGYSQSVKLTVLPIKKLTFANRLPTSLQIGQSVTLYVVASYSDGNRMVITNHAALTSSNTRVVKVLRGGKMIAVGSGSATIQAKVNGHVATWSVKVAPRLTGIKVIYNPRTLKAGGTPSYIIVKARYSDGSLKNVTSKASIKAINSNVRVRGNKVYGISAGKGIVNVRYMGRSIRLVLLIIKRTGP